MLAMKKLILILAVVAFATTAWAQETPKKPSFAGFVSNGFWDNWEMSLGGGVGTALTNGSNSGSFGKRLGFEANFSLVKWVHPVVGMRLQLQGGQFANYDADLGKLKWPYLFVHSDFMLNFSNWAGGYRDDRAYYLVPFVGFGYLATNFTDKSQEDNMTGHASGFRILLRSAQQIPLVTFVRLQYRAERHAGAFARMPREDGRFLPVRLQRYCGLHLPL